MEVYTIDGKLLKQQYADNDAMQIHLGGQGIYIVRMQGKAKSYIKICNST